MPGNGVGDRVHNSFGQENLSQGQHQFKADEKNLPGLSKSIWIGSHSRNGFPLIPNLKNYSVPQSANIDSGHEIPYFQAVNGLNASPLNLRSEVAESQFQNQQTALNGFMPVHTTARQYEANFLGVDADSYQNTVTSKGLPIFELHHGNSTDLPKKDFGRFPNVQPPVSFNSFGSQEQMGSQHTGVLQSWQKQQSGINDMQLLQQQMILRQLQDNQRQPFQHQGFWQQNSPMNLLSSIGNQAAANHSPALLNGIPVHDSSDKPWPELLASNPNSQHFGASAIVQGSSSGFEVSSQQSQTLCTTGLVLQQCDYSLYGVPIPGTKNNLSKTFQIKSENPTMQQISSLGNSFSRSQHAAPPDHDNKHGPLVSRPVGSPPGHNSISGFESSNLQQLLPSEGNAPMQEFPGKLELAGSSDTTQEKTSLATLHSQNSTTLDPAEEKILFGSDDNLWEAFGGEMNRGLGGFNMPEGSSSLGGIPSLQSGSWSALMQSALAETSSVETGQQEEWSGLSFRSIEPSTGYRQPATFNNGFKQEQRSARGESTEQADPSFFGAFGHQLDHRASHERFENMQTDSFPRYIEESSAGNKHSELSLVAKPSNESILIRGKADGSPMADAKQHSSGPWTHQQSISSNDERAQLNDRANDWNAIGSREPGESSYMKSHSSGMLLQPSWSGSHNREALEFHGATAGNDTIHGLAVGIDQLKPLGCTMLRRQDSSTSKVAINSGSSKAFQESTQLLQNNQSFNFWRQVDTSANSRGSDSWGKSHHASPGPVQENASVDGSDSHNLRGHQVNSSGRAVQRLAGVPKFQNHLMGGLGVDIDSSQSKGRAYIPSATQQVSNKFFPVGGSGGSMSMNKSAQPSQNMLELLQKLDQSKEHEAASHLSSYDRNDAYEAETSDGSVGQLQQNQCLGSKGFGLQLALPSQQLQNLDRAVHSQGSSSVPNSAQISSDRLEIDHTPPVSAPLGQSLSSQKEPFEGEMRNHITGASEQANDKSSIGFISGFPFSRNHLQNQHDAGRALLVSHSKLIENTSEGFLPSQSALTSTSTSKGSDASALEGAQAGIHPLTGRLPPKSLVSEASPVSHPSLTPSVPQQCVFSGGQSTTVPGSTASGLLKSSVQLNDNDLQKGVGGVMELSASVSFKPSELSRTGEAAQSLVQGKVDSVNHASDAALPRSVSNNISHQSYSLLHQMQPMKNAGLDLSGRTFKRFRGPDRGVDSETVALGGNQLSYDHSDSSGDVQPSHPGVDAKVSDLSGKQGDNWDASSPSLHMDALQQTGSPHSSSNYEVFLRRDHSQINPPMAPLWIDHPGTLSNGQALQVLDAERMAARKHVEQARLVQEPADSFLVPEPANQFRHDSGASPVNSTYSCLPVSARTENISSQNSLPPEVTDQGLLMEQKKRKIAATSVLAWHKEVMTSARLQSASTTEIEWARAANRLVQKMEDETETIEDGLPSRPRKRLILTTHLMQQMLRPPPAPFLAGDSRSHYKNVTYCINKSAMGDACRAIHFSSNDPSMPNSAEKILLEKHKVSERSDSDSIAKAVEDLVRRTKMLDNGLLRLDQKSSIVDLRVDLQDLERFSIINRFARFHGRSQSDGNGASSSDPFSFASRPVPQRYVMALPMPRNLPDSVQCLSL